MWNVLRVVHWKYRMQKMAKHSPFGTIAQLCPTVSFICYFQRCWILIWQTVSCCCSRCLLLQLSPSSSAPMLSSSSCCWQSAPFSLWVPLSPAHCLSVCLSVRGRTPTLLHGPGCNLGRGRGCPLVVHNWADLQSGHGLRCYGNITRTLVTSLRPSCNMTT